MSADEPKHSMTQKRKPLLQQLLLMTAFLFAIALIAALGMIFLQALGRRLNVHWLATADTQTLKLLSLVFIVCPIVFPSLNALERRKKAKQLAAGESIELKTADPLTGEPGFQWSIPLIVELKRMHVFYMFTAMMYLATFLIVSLFFGAANLSDHWRHLPPECPALWTAFKCANAIALFLLALPVLFFGLGVRVQITLGRHDLIESLGAMRKAYPYHTITQCRIEPSPRVPKLTSLVFHTEDSEDEHRFEFGCRVPVEGVVSFLQSKGITINARSPGRNPSPSAPS